MKTTVCFFASTRYWNNDKMLKGAFQSLEQQIPLNADEIHLITEEKDLENLSANGILIAIPMSGAVQPLVLKAACGFESVLLLPGYLKGNFEDTLTREMLVQNAAPAVMDIYAVVRRIQPNVFFCLDMQELTKVHKAVRAALALKTKKLILIGEVEPWVISVDRNLQSYREKLGIEIISVKQEELEQAYVNTTAEQAGELYTHWKTQSAHIEEPQDDDIVNAARFNRALIDIIEKYNADGVAIACFNLLKVGTTACLGVSYINNHTGYIAACEGDLDSAVTMLLLKQIASDKLWMANPNLQPDRSINFVHCTAPTTVAGSVCPYTLRNHHESGIGVSTQVELPLGQVTACRISVNHSEISVLKGTSGAGEYEPSCRTQLKVTPQDFDRYIENSLGCHMVIAFEDIAKEMSVACKVLGFTEV